MVAQDTPQKRNDLEQTIALSIPVPAALTTQELTEIAQAVKRATNIDKLGWDTSQSEVVMRDPDFPRAPRPGPFPAAYVLRRK